MFVVCWNMLENKTFDLLTYWGSLQRECLRAYVKRKLITKSLPVCWTYKTLRTNRESEEKW